MSRRPCEDNNYKREEILLRGINMIAKIYITFYDKVKCEIG